MNIVTSSSRGQIVIPKNIRNELRIGPGKKLLIKTEGDHAILMPLPDDPVEHFCGYFKDRSSLTKALLDERAKDRDRESNKVV
jgi:AbrB family looped-hinge helix DNA binding protein